MRIPLVCTFFAEQKELLFDSNMFKIFQAVLLEQGAWEIESENSNDNVPDLTRKSLGTPTGLLENELLTSRDVVMSPLIRILKFAINIATHKTSSIHSKSACFVLSMFRLATILSAYEENILSPFRDDIVEILRHWIRSARNEVSSDGRKGVGNVPMLTVLYVWCSSVRVSLFLYLFSCISFPLSLFLYLFSYSLTVFVIFVCVHLSVGVRVIFEQYE